MSAPARRRRRRRHRRARRGAPAGRARAARRRRSTSSCSRRPRALGGSVGTERTDGFVDRARRRLVHHREAVGAGAVRAARLRRSADRHARGRAPHLRRARRTPASAARGLPPAGADGALAARALAAVLAGAGKLRMALDLVLPRAARRAATRAWPRSSAAGSAARRSSASPSRWSAASTPPIPSACRSRPPCRASSSWSARTGSVDPRAPRRATRGRARRRGRALRPVRRAGATAWARSSTRSRARLPEGVVRLRTPVDGARARRRRAGALRAGGEPLDADAVVARDAGVRRGARCSAPLDAALARDARAHRVRVVGDRDARLPRAPTSPARSRGFGFVVPARRAPAAARLHLREPEVSRAARPRATSCCAPSSAARAGPSWSSCDDAALVATVRDELRALLGIAAEPMLVRVERYRRAMPQYAVGHLDRVARDRARASRRCRASRSPARPTAASASPTASAAARPPRTRWRGASAVA